MLFIVARLSEKVMSIVLVVCCLRCVVLLGCHVCAAPPTVLVYRWVRNLPLLTDHTDAQVVYIQYSVTLITVTFFSRDHRLLPMSHDIDCWYVHGILI